MSITSSLSSTTGRFATLLLFVSMYNSQPSCQNYFIVLLQLRFYVQSIPVDRMGKASYEAQLSIIYQYNFKIIICRIKYDRNIGSPSTSDNEYMRCSRPMLDTSASKWFMFKLRLYSLSQTSYINAHKNVHWSFGLAMEFILFCGINVNEFRYCTYFKQKQKSGQYDVQTWFWQYCYGSCSTLEGAIPNLSFPIVTLTFKYSAIVLCVGSFLIRPKRSCKTSCYIMFLQMKSNLTSLVYPLNSKK